MKSSCVLNSSAYDGGVGAEWYTLAWDAFIPGSTSACVRTRTADRADLLSAEAWSDCYPPGSGGVTSLDRRFIQYQIELETSDTIVTPVFFENLITYTPGSYLPASYLSFNAPFSGDSQTTVDLTATLMDENNAPIVGRTVSFALDGLPAVSGITDENGIASAALPLEIAPGDYLLQVSFTSDGVYGPSSTSAAFAVTESWSEWIQDSEVDFGSGTSNGVDTISIPGSVILLSQLIGEGEEGGAFSVSGAPGWTYRRRLFIDNPNTSELPAGYSIKLSLDTASLVSNGKLLENGDDLRLVYHDGETQVELHRLNDTPFNTANTEIWFKTYAPIPAGASDDNFYIYYGNPGAGAPLADPAQVWAFWDTFDGATLNTALWNPAGSITVSGGQAHLAVGADLFSNSPFTNGVLEVNLKTVGEDAYMWWGWEDGRADAPNFIVFEEYASPTNLTALVRSDGSPYTSFSIADPVGGLTTWHSYITDWAPGQARWLIDGVQMHTTTSNVPTSPMNININAVARGIDVEWVRVRLRAAQEPLVSLSSTYSVYLSPGMLQSVPFDTGQHSGWKYLVWDALTPGGTSLNLELRTASTQEGLESAEWVNYAASGLLITNPDARWIQYRATLTTADPDVTPELQRVVIYYINLNQPPIVDAGVQYNGNEGSSIALGDATASDPDDDDLTYAWSVSSPQCTFSDPSVLNPTMVCDDNGGYTATLTVSDGVNDPVSSNAEVFVNNVAPMGTLNTPVEVDEGSDINLSLTGSFDPSAADTAAGFEYAFDCGDGNGYGAFSGDNSTVCPTDDNGLRTVGNKIRDKDGGETEYTAQLTVHNVAPTLSPIGVTTDLVLLGSSINASASFSDPGAADTHTVVWNWGDEQTTTVENATSPFSTEHTYAETGVYIVQLIVTDDDGGSASESYEFIVVYNPDGGYVMGNGWLWSDPGAYVADPSLEGYAMFGFVSRYRPGANVPSGRTKFVFMVGDLDFQSSSYDWLVITGSNYARFKGVGTVNGELAPNGEAYKFQIWARDDAPDTFRIKIWYEVDEVEIVVYDNTMHQPIGGGNIVISTK